MESYVPYILLQFSAPATQTEGQIKAYLILFSFSWHIFLRSSTRLQVPTSVLYHHGYRCHSHPLWGSCTRAGSLRTAPTLQIHISVFEQSCCLLSLLRWLYRSCYLLSWLARGGLALCISKMFSPALLWFRTKKGEERSDGSDISLVNVYKRILAVVNINPGVCSFLLKAKLKKYNFTVCYSQWVSFLFDFSPLPPDCRLI